MFSKCYFLNQALYARALYQQRNAYEEQDNIEQPTLVRAHSGRFTA